MKTFVQRPFKGAMVKVYCSKDTLAEPEFVKYGRLITVINDTEKGREIACLKKVEAPDSIEDIHYFFDKGKVVFTILLILISLSGYSQIGSNYQNGLTPLQKSMERTKAIKSVPVNTKVIKTTKIKSVTNQVAELAKKSKEVKTTTNYFIWNPYDNFILTPSNFYNDKIIKLIIEKPGSSKLFIDVSL